MVTKIFIFIFLLSLSIISIGWAPQVMRFGSHSTTVPAFAHIASTYTQSPTFTGSVTTTGINAFFANIVIVTINGFGSTPSISDGIHTWTRIAGAQYASTSGQFTDVFYCVGSFSSSVAITTSNISYISVSAFSGAAALPVDVFGGGTSAAGATNVSSSSVTPGFSGDLLITVSANGNVPTAAGPPTVSPVGVNIIGAVAFNAGIAYNSGSGYQILSSLASTSVLWSFSNANTTGAACSIVLFKHS